MFNSRYDVLLLVHYKVRTLAKILLITQCDRQNLPVVQPISHLRIFHRSGVHRTFNYRKEWGQRLKEGKKNYKLVKFSRKHSHKIDSAESVPSNASSLDPGRRFEDCRLTLLARRGFPVGSELSRTASRAKHRWEIWLIFRLLPRLLSSRSLQRFVDYMSLNLQFISNSPIGGLRTAGDNSAGKERTVDGVGGSRFEVPFSVLTSDPMVEII